MKHRCAKFRPSVLEILEDRAVPSAGGTSLHASSSGSGGSSSLQAQLNRIDAQVNAAYATFATSVRQAEVTLVSAGVGMPAAGTAASVAVQVAQDAATLQSQVTSAVIGQAIGNSQGLLEQQLTGRSPGSLTVGLAQLLNTASVGFDNGPVPQSSLDLLFTAVDGVIASSLRTTSIEVDLYLSGSHVSGSVTSSSSFNLVQYGNQVNAAYATFATGVRQAETMLVSPGGLAAPVNVASQVGQQIQSLVQTFHGIEAKTPLASDATLIESQFVGTTPGALSDQVASLLVASTVGSTDGSVPTASLPLLFSAVDVAINASYNASAVEGDLFAVAAATAPKTIAELNGGGATPTLYTSYGVFFAF